MHRRVLVLVAFLVFTSGCGPRVEQCCPPGTRVAANFASPPQYPGYAWTKDGHEVPPSEIVAAAGPDHCGWHSATFLTIGWPLGTRPETAEHARQYIRDPNGVVSQALHARLRFHATLPADAQPSGYWYGAVQLYTSASDVDESVYLVAGDDVERWPRSEPMTLYS